MPLPIVPHVDITKETSYVKNLELIFSEWNINGEPWDEPWEPDESVTYPSYLDVFNETTIRAAYGLDVDVTANKKDKKKSNGTMKSKKGTPSHAMDDQDIDENGRKLPKILFEDNATSYDCLKWVKGFACSNDGGEIDTNMCDVIRIILRFAPSLDLSSPNNEYLWNAIYPKKDSGRPCFNPSGRYCVRLYFGGKWRKIHVDDSIPVRSDGSWAICHSSESMELWPAILSKAVYAAYSKCR